MKLKTLFAAAALTVAASAANANLVTNGDFSNGGAGWSLTGNTGFSSFPNQWLDGAVGSDAFLTQNIATVSGGTYNISFDTGVNWGHFSGFLGGVNFFTGGSGHWNFVVTANQNNAALTFSTRNDPSWNWLDNVVVTAANVPEPTPLAIFGLGLIGLAVARRKA